MTVKEIAKLANVSTSTVSKILNGKDQTISCETRKKVLDIVKEYHYNPYQSVLGAAGGGRFLLGVIIRESGESRKLLAGIIAQAGAGGYMVLVSSYGGQEDGERKAIERLLSQNLGGVIWQRSGGVYQEYEQILAEKRIPVLYADSLFKGGNRDQIFSDYEHLGYELARYLTDRGHQKLACLYPNELDDTVRFLEGVQRCLYEYQIPYTKEIITKWTDGFSLNEKMLSGITAVICFDEAIAGDVCRKAAENGYHIPEDLSVISAGDPAVSALMTPAVTTIAISPEKLGQRICRSLIGRIEQTQTADEESEEIFFAGGSVRDIRKQRKAKIVVVGAMNIDTVINVKEFPNPGQTLVSESLTVLPGGKGSNQAAGAAKLGAQVFLIGKLGQDYEAKILRDAMAELGVNQEGVTEIGFSGTGKALITVQQNGESNIVIYPGANRYLSPGDVERHSGALENARFCLLQTETPAETVEYAAALARRRGVKVMLKPAAVSHINSGLLSDIDYLIPNEKELHLLLPGEGSVEEKAEYFLEKGVSHVIVTLGEQGCYLRDRKHSLYFSAGDFKAVDTTGAADAFIAALAVYLAEGTELTMAVRIASYAAGCSVTRPGVQSAMVSRPAMNLCMEEISRQIRMGTKRFS